MGKRFAQSPTFANIGMAEAVAEWQRLYNTARGEIETLTHNLASECTRHDETAHKLREAEAKAQQHWNAYVGAESQRQAASERERISNDHRQRAERAATAGHERNQELTKRLRELQDEIDAAKEKT